MVGSGGVDVEEGVGSGVVVDSLVDEEAEEEVVLVVSSDVVEG